MSTPPERADARAAQQIMNDFKINPEYPKATMTTALSHPKVVRKIPLTPEILTPLISEYLGNGGLFNPEMMDHEKVRELLMQCRECLERDARLLTLYRMKRANDGLNGRRWSAREHLDAEEAIARMEAETELPKS